MRLCADLVVVRRFSAVILLGLTLPAWGLTSADGPADGVTGAAGMVDVRGMTVSASRSGQSWGSDAMVETMRRLRALGVNWIAIHPYGRIDGDGTVGILRGLPLGEDVRWLRRPIEEAHRLGLKIMIKPHLAYWHSPFEWRGKIEFQTAEDWDRFFITYERWLTRLAEICADADAFVVGTELDRTVHHEARWRAIIAAVRARTKGRLTYAANWDAYQRVPFWDALDVIGIQAYFPLVDHEALPEPAELRASWRRIATELEAYGRRHHRRILLSELGYHRSATTALRPWEPRPGDAARPEAEEVQRRCLQAALGAVDDSEIIVGTFLWKWFPGERAGGSHLMSTPAMRAVIGEQWGTAASPVRPAPAEDVPESGSR